MKNKSDEKLFQKLDEFNVEVPDFPMRKSRIEKAGDWLFDSTRLPEFEFTERGMVLALFLPVLISTISAIPLIFL
ncbi:hypothetical protein J6TS1_10980 [Siminovitchia terrae]|uniref:Uncharacterized protein n=1 Tax=Siminovitchia terrae TaxID=1914933 RepID=A0A429X539_SIMTE|nr:hypothetical protein [Siminovitchia terrae]RST58526.1 hypothetical protein D5F11_017015 [Siminovitchia terrae]GIN89163.1 hypothetical protein J22TS1_02140 [Siminovitchia terrae]GIN95228.1 hypothetical protein J6TS1_10980 [Siminovitchia terrae]